MAGGIETLHSIRAWAQETFPNSFAKVDRYHRANRALPFVRTNLNADNRDLKPQTIKAVQVGSLTDPDGEDVWAWIEADGFVKLGHRVRRHMILHRDTTSPKVNFDKPFCWVRPSEDETGAARFEALVRYYVCINDANTPGLRSKVATFKEHFEGACRDVAEQITRRRHKKSAARRSLVVSKLGFVVANHEQKTNHIILRVNPCAASNYWSHFCAPLDTRSNTTTAAISVNDPTSR